MRRLPSRRAADVEYALIEPRHPPTGYLLTGVTIEARPGPVEVLGGTLSHRLPTVVRCLISTRGSACQALPGRC